MANDHEPEIVTSRPAVTAVSVTGRALLLLLLACVAWLPVALVIAGGVPPTASTAMNLGADAVTQLDLLAWGGELYAVNCSVCHGATGGGLVEAKLAFPADHRNCTRCHKPNNRVVQPLSEPFIDNDMFSIGDPPPLRVLAASDGGLAALAQPSAILAYIAATMPRYDPGRLSHDDYIALTAHLLAMNGRVNEVVELPALTAPADPTRP